MSSSSELVQVDLGSCGQYGPQCEDCVLARDPYCGWNGTHCTPATGYRHTPHCLLSAQHRNMYCGVGELRVTFDL